MNGFFQWIADRRKLTIKNEDWVCIQLGLLAVEPFLTSAQRAFHLRVKPVSVWQSRIRSITWSSLTSQREPSLIDWRAWAISRRFKNEVSPPSSSLKWERLMFESCHLLYSWGVGSCPETKDAKKVRPPCHHAQSVRSLLHLRGPVQPVKGEDSVILLSSFAWETDTLCTQDDECHKRDRRKKICLDSISIFRHLISIIRE